MTDGAMRAQRWAEAAHPFLSKYCISEGQQRCVPAWHGPLPNREKQQQEVALLQINQGAGENQMF